LPRADAFGFAGPLAGRLPRAGRLAPVDAVMVVSFLLEVGWLAAGRFSAAGLQVIVRSDESGASSATPASPTPTLPSPIKGGGEISFRQQ
jgi:hypothetical protein